MKEGRERERERENEGARENNEGSVDPGLKPPHPGERAREILRKMISLSVRFHV